MSLVRVKDGLFPGFPRRISLDVGRAQRWAVLGPKKRYLLEVLAAKHTPEPPKAVSYPSFGHEVWPSQAITMVTFGQVSSAPYLAARYESFRDEFDYSLRTVLEQASTNQEAVEWVLDQLHLRGLEDRWAASLSNGQTRRAQLALALLKNPKLLIVDDPFLGLDPTNKQLMDRVLCNLPVPVIIGLISSSLIPDWVTDLAVARTDGVVSGPRAEVDYADPVFESRGRRDAELREPVVELRGVTVAYKDKPVFDDLWLTVRAGERVHIQGPNGSGKSTLLALITADHPQSWNEKVVLFGEPREVGKQSYFSINEDIGHSSPELHAIFPRHLSVRECIGTGFANDFVRPKLQSDRASHVKQLMERLRLNPEAKFGELGITEQKLVLFARALVKDPRILILDEAFSTLDSENLALAFEVLDDYPGAVLLVGHVPQEIPPCDNVLTLEES